MRRLVGMVMLAVMAGALTPAALAVAATEPQTKPDQRFGVRLVDVPVAEANDPRALRYIVDYLPTGTTVHRRILVMNDETRTAHFTVYPDAAQISHETFTGAAGETRSELTSWISVQHRVLTVPPESSVMDLVTIKVPRGATRGEHYAVVWVQQSALAHTTNGFGINDVVRVGVRLYVAVGRGGAPPTNFTITSITGHRSAQGQPSILVHVENTGGRAIDLNGTARLSGGPGNSTAGPFPARQIITLAPGQSGSMSFTPGKSLPDGPWQAKVTLRSGFTTSTATQTIEFAAISSRTGLSLAAWGGIAIGVALALALALILARRARRHRVQPEESSPDRGRTGLSGRTGR
jgi:hypothetical protein